MSIVTAETAPGPDSRVTTSEFLGYIRKCAANLGLCSEADSIDGDLRNGPGLIIAVSPKDLLIVDGALPEAAEKLAVIVAAAYKLESRFLLHDAAIAGRILRSGIPLDELDIIRADGDGKERLMFEHSYPRGEEDAILTVSEALKKNLGGRKFTDFEYHIAVDHAGFPINSTSDFSYFDEKTFFEYLRKAEPLIESAAVLLASRKSQGDVEVDLASTSSPFRTADYN